MGCPVRSRAREWVPGGGVVDREAPVLAGQAQPPMALPGEFAAAEACQAPVLTLEPGERVLLYGYGVMRGAAQLAPSSGSNG